MACTVAVTTCKKPLRHSGGRGRRGEEKKAWPGESFPSSLQGENPPLPEVPEEGAEHGGAAGPCYDEGPLESVGHLEQGDLEVHAENSRDHAEDGHHECRGGQEQLELDQLVPDVILQISAFVMVM